MRKIAIIPVLGLLKKKLYDIDFLITKIQQNITNALDTKLFDEVIVASENETILKLAATNGANTFKFIFEKQFSKMQLITKVLADLFSFYRKKGIQIQYGCCIYPDAVMASSNILRMAFEQLTREDFDSLFPITAYEYPCQKAFLLQDKRLQKLMKNVNKIDEELLPPTFYDSEQFYLFNVERFLKSEKLLTQNTGAIILPDRKIVDIQNHWKLSEIKFETQLQIPFSEDTNLTKYLISMVDPKTL